MKKRIILFLMIAPIPAAAQTIRAEDAWDHFGEYVTVEGQASVQRMPSGEIYLDFDGSGDGAPLSAYIPRPYAWRFSDISALNGKTVAIRGDIGSFRYRPEIFLTNPDQLAVVAHTNKEPAGNKPAGSFSIRITGN
jgi:hypothetical protein